MLPRIDYTKNTTTGYFFKRDGESIHLNIEHPENILSYISQLPKLTSVHFNFNKAAFKSSKISYEEILMEVLENTKLTRLIISITNQDIKLPPSILTHPLISLNINRVEKITNLEHILPLLQELEELVIGGGFCQLGESFPTLPNLRFLNIACKEVQSLNQLSNCSQLEEVTISGLEIEQLPNGFLQLPELRILILRGFSKLQKLPTLEKASKLEKLTLTNFPCINNINIAFSNLPKLKEAHLYSIGTNYEKIDFPIELTNCTQLNQLTIENLPIHSLPIELSNLTLLEVFHFSYLPLKEIPNAFHSLKSLKDLRVKICHQLKSVKHFESLKNLELLVFGELGKLEHIDIDFSNWKNLKHFSCNSLLKLRSIDSTLTSISNLETISLSNLPLLDSLPPFSKNNLSIKSIGLSGIDSIIKLPDSYAELTNLERLDLKTDSIKSLPEDIGQLQNLTHFTCYDKKLTYIPLSIVDIKKLLRIEIYRNHADDKEVTSAGEIFPLLKDIDDQELKRAIIYWIGNAYRHLPITDNIKLKTLESLSLPIKNYDLFLLQKIHYLNPNNSPIDISQLKKEDKVWINGNIQGTKTDLKNKLKSLGLKVVNKFSKDIGLVILGKKPSIPEGLFKDSILFASQLEIEKISSQINPKLLEKSDVPPEFIENLQQLLWSDDPQNEAIALELVKSNGLPESVEEDFLLSAKVCKDKKVRSRIRTFLKGKISPVKQKVLSVGGAHFAVRKLMYTLPKEPLTKMYFSQFKRNGDCVKEFLNLDQGEHSGRNQVFQAHLSTLLSKPKYVNEYMTLLEEEWNTLFANPIFKGNLNRINISLNFCKSIPSALKEHAGTLKTMEIRIPDEFDFSSLYLFSKLTKLQVNCQKPGKVIVPSGLAQLSNLREFTIQSSHPISMPKDLAELKKLKTLNIGLFKNKEDFKDQLAHLKYF